MKKLRLLFTQDCDRFCKGCCNKDWDLDALPKVTHFNYSEILITGGEPLLYPYKLYALIAKIKKKSNAKVIVYTASTKSVAAFMEVLFRADGITLTLHKQSDVSDNFKKICARLRHYPNKSLRLNVFKGIDYSGIPGIEHFTVKNNIEWVKDCPLPIDEEFKKY